MSEVWKPIPGWEDRYEISSFGNVRSFEHVTSYTNRHGTVTHGCVPAKVIKIYTTPDKYQYFYLIANKKKTRFDLADTMAEIFLGKRPHGFRVVHADGNPANNFLSNISYQLASHGDVRPYRLTDGESEFIADQYTLGKSLADSAVACGRTHTVLEKIIKSHGVQKRDTLSYNVNGQFFNSIDTPEKAYWLGFVSADGHADNLVLSLRLSDRDKTHLEKFAKSIDSTHPIKIRKNNMRNKCCVIKVHSADLVAGLSQHIKTENKTWNISPWHGPTELMPHYWRGVVDGDGWVSTTSNGPTKYFYTVGMCGNHAMVKGFRDFIHRTCGYKNKLVEKKLKSGKPFYQVAYTGTRRAKHICKILKYNCSESISLDRKQETANKILIGPNNI